MLVSLKMQVVSGKGSLDSLMPIILSNSQQHQHLGACWKCRTLTIPRPSESESAFSQVPQQFLYMLGLRSSDLGNNLKKTIEQGHNGKKAVSRNMRIWW